MKILNQNDQKSKEAEMTALTTLRYELSVMETLTKKLGITVSGH